MKCPYGYTCEGCTELDACEYDPSDEELAFSEQVDSFAIKAKYIDSKIKERQKAYYRKHRQALIDNSKKYYYENKAKCLEYQKKYQGEKAAEIRAYKRKYYLENKEKYLERSRLQSIKKRKGAREHEAV